MNRTRTLLIILLISSLTWGTLTNAATTQQSTYQVDLGLQESQQTIGCEYNPCSFTLYDIQITATRPPSGAQQFTEMITDTTGKIINMNDKALKRQWSETFKSSKVAIDRPVWSMTLPEGSYTYQLLLNKKVVAKQNFQLEVVKMTTDSLSLDQQMNADTVQANDGWKTVGEPMSVGRDDLEITIKQIEESWDEPDHAEVYLQLTNRSDQSAVSGIGELQFTFKTTDQQLNPVQYTAPKMQGFENIRLKPGQSITVKQLLYLGPYLDAVMNDVQVILNTTYRLEL